MMKNAVLFLIVGVVICSSFAYAQSDTEKEVMQTILEGEASCTQSSLSNFSDVIGDSSLIKLKSRLNELNTDIQNRGLILDTIYSKKKLITGYKYGQFYDWDLYFENIYMSYYGISGYNFNNLDVFFAMQQPDGFIKRALGPKSYGSTQMFKPFIAQIVVLGSRQVENFDWAKQNYSKLKLYLNRWFEYDTDSNGLIYWPGGADHSGKDQQNSRCKGKSEGVDLNSYMVRELEAMAIIASELGYLDDKKDFTSHSEKMKSLINKYLWDEKSGFYYDRDEEDGKTTFVKSISGFTPIWANIATTKMTKRLVEEHLTNTEEFWLSYPVATYAKNEPDYYQTPIREYHAHFRGTSWIPTNYMICHGLSNYGYIDLSKELAYKTFNMVLENNSTREFYDAETGQGYGMVPFFGWSSLAYFLPLEIEMQYDPTNINEKNIKKLGEIIDVPFNLETE